MKKVLNKKVIKNKFSVKKFYKESFKTIKQTKNFIYFSVGLFALLAIVGFIFPIFFVEQIMRMLEQLVLSFEGLSTFKIILKIFFNNALVSLISILFGLLIGLFPLWAIVQNGYILGFVVKKVIIAESITTLWRILPHGIFELPAIFVSMGLGLKLGIKVITADGPLKFLKESLKVFIGIIIPLLVIAAIIEGLLIGSGI